MDKLLEILKEIMPGCDVENEQDFIGNKKLDSFSIMRLVVKLSDEFDVEITPVDMVPENFKNATTIMNLIRKLED